MIQRSTEQGRPGSHRAASGQHGPAAARRTPAQGQRRPAARQTPAQGQRTSAGGQHAPAQGQRALTPEQRRRVLEMRRRRKRQRQLRLAIVVGLATVAVIALVLALSLRRGGSDERGEALPVNGGVATELGSGKEAALDGGVDADLGEGADGGAQADPGEAAGGENSSADGVEPSSDEIAEGEGPAAGSVPDASASENAGDSEQAQVTYQPANGVFVFDEAYAAAAQGAVTGPSVSLNLGSVDPTMLVRWPAAKEGYIPALYSANTTERIIAVTVDDCFQASNLRDIVQCALDNNAKLTVFPIGRNLAQSEIASAVKWAWQQGMEIENHSYKHGGTYHYDDDYMTNDIWTQSYALNQALGVNYKEHFFRPKGGDERDDQRTHAYVSQLGMAGIAMWSVTGSSNSQEHARSNLAPGAIYLFHTTNADRELLLNFIPYAVQQGYKLVTLNEMFGLPENEVSDLSTAATEKPALQSFQIIPMQLRKTTYARAAAPVQQRLIDLGWLDGEADAVFGESSFIATGYFQLAAGLKADGIAGAQTQAALFAPDAPRKQ